MDNAGSGGCQLYHPSAVVVEALVGGAPLVEGIFIARPNRFVVEAELAGGEHILAHLADRGRLLWLKPGMKLLLGVKGGQDRKTPYQVAAALRDEVWSSLDTHLPNRLVERALRMSALPQFSNYVAVRREVRHATSRFDFGLVRTHNAAVDECVIEVKSAGDVRQGAAWFPDAPTERGVRHLAELAALRQGGLRTAVVFVVQAGGAHAVQANVEVDPIFARALHETLCSDVEVYAYSCRVEREGLCLERAIPVLDRGT